MKYITLFISLFLIFCIDSFGQAYIKLDASAADSTKIKIAEKFAFDYMTAQKNDAFYQFKDEAIGILKTQLTEERQKAGYKQLRDNFGDFKSLDYAETWIQKDNSDYKIIRFKSDFEKNPNKLEIRVILNAENKVAGFWIKPWSDELK
jgi:hypothetical protein